MTDSNLWIDLHHSDHLARIFCLPWELLAPDVIIAELEVPAGIDLLELGLIERELSSEQVMQVAMLSEKYLRPSRADLFALVLAMVLKAILLTGDGALRDAGLDFGLEVHGMIWVLDQMVDQEIISTKERACALVLMLKAKSRLPREEVEIRLRDAGIRDTSWF